MENPNVSSAFPPRDKNSTLTLVLIGVVIILCLGFIVVVMGYIGLTSNTNSNTTNQTTENDNNSLVATEPNITIESPIEESIVNGIIEVSGTATYHFTNITVEAFDELNNRLGTASVTISSVADSVTVWKTNLELIKSPRTSSGRIVVSASEPEFEKSINIEFESSSQTPGTLIIYSPIPKQTLLGESLYIKGEAKGLFEGVLNIRIKDSNNSEIFTDSFTIPDQLIEFREFEYTVNIENLSSVETDSGEIEFYFNSAMDGSEVILQTIPINFN